MGVATAAANVWNNASGQFCYVTEGGDHYTVNFDLNVVESPNLYPESGEKWGSLTLTDGFSNDKSGKANVFYTVNTLGQQELSNGDTGSVNGQTTNGNAIRVTNARATDSETSAHEMGHTLGMHHTSKGLMTEKSNMSSRNGRPTAKNVQESIHSAMKGKTNDAGKGTFITDKTYTKDELQNLQKGKVE